MAASLRRMVLAVLLLCFALPGAALAPFALAQSGRVANQPAAVVIAVVAPASPRFAVVGLRMTTGAERAVADINDRGGIKLGQARYRVKLLRIAEACEPAKDEGTAKRLRSKRVRLVVGYRCAGSAIAAAKVYTDDDIVLIATGVDHPRFTDQRAGRGIFRLGPRRDRQTDLAAGHLARAFPGSRIAIIHDSTVEGAADAAAMRAALTRFGLKEVLYAGFRPSQKDYGKLIAELVKTQADVVFLASYATEGGVIARQLKSAMPRPAIISVDRLAEPSYWTVAATAAEGTLLTRRPDRYRLQRPLSVSAHETGDAASRHKPPDNREAQLAYAAIEAWAAAVAIAGSWDAVGVGGALGARPLPTILGEIAFDQRGDSSLQAYTIHRWHRGKVSPLTGATAR